MSEMAKEAGVVGYLGACLGVSPVWVMTQAGSEIRGRRLRMIFMLERSRGRDRFWPDLGRVVWTESGSRRLRRVGSRCAKVVAGVL